MLVILVVHVVLGFEVNKLKLKLILVLAYSCAVAIVSVADIVDRGLQ
jgi:hypothetical protein